MGGQSTWVVRVHGSSEYMGGQSTWVVRVHGSSEYMGRQSTWVIRVHGVVTVHGVGRVHAASDYFFFFFLISYQFCDTQFFHWRSWMYSYAR